MQYIADAKEAKEIDGISIQKIGIPSFVLMERAALKVAECVKMLARRKSDRILIVCGTGNNGGDGVAAGRILAEWGYQVAITLPGGEEKLSEDLRLQLSVARKLSIPVLKEPGLSEYTVIVDAIFGIGLSREIHEVYAEWIDAINVSDAAVVAVDIPSGVNASDGRILGTAIQADYTVTFGVNKRGLVLFPGTLYAGEVWVADIGFPGKAIEEVSPAVVSYERDDLLSLFPTRLPRSHKGSYGKTLVIAGSEQIGGAAYFSAAAAYLLGSGLVRVFTHENNRTLIQTKLPEALLSTYQELEVFPEELKEELATVTAIVIGPGLGTSHTAECLLREVLKCTKIPVVLDADALNLLAGFPEYFDEEKRLLLPDNFVLTPHLKEMSRLSGRTVAEIQENLIDTACCQTKGAVIVLKDARTVISDGTHIYLNQSGNNALAKGGSGDVLSGVIGGLLARGMEPVCAASLGVYLHGLTAEEYVKKGSSSAMLASDILAELPGILP